MERPKDLETGNSKNSAIAEELGKMVAIDQEMRMKSQDPDFKWDEQIDLRNTEAMKRIIAEIGWPTVSKVGEEGSRDAWLLVQHADHDPDFQQHCLSLMKEQPAGEVSPIDIAYLEDRVRVNTSRGQVYGTQFREIRNEANAVTWFGPQPIEDEEHVDERRTSVGLGSMGEYRRAITKRYYPHLLDGNDPV